MYNFWYCRSSSRFCGYWYRARTITPFPLSRDHISSIRSSYGNSSSTSFFLAAIRCSSLRLESYSSAVWCFSLLPSFSEVYRNIYYIITPILWAKATLNCLLVNMLLKTKHAPFTHTCTEIYHQKLAYLTIGAWGVLCNLMCFVVHILHTRVYKRVKSPIDDPMGSVGSERRHESDPLNNKYHEGRTSVVSIHTTHNYY